MPGDLLAALSDERHGDPRKVTGSSQRSPLHAAGSGRCLHFGKCACKRQLVPSRTSAGLGEQKANQAVCGPLGRPKARARFRHRSSVSRQTRRPRSQRIRQRAVPLRSLSVSLAWTLWEPACGAGRRIPRSSRRPCEPATGLRLGPTSCLGPGPIARLLPAFTPGGIGECRDLMGAGALRNSVREGRDAGMGRFHRFLPLLGCTSRVLWLSYWAPHLLLPEVEPVRRFLEPRIEPLLEPPGSAVLLADTRRQPLGISNSGVAQRHQVIPELTLPSLQRQSEHGADHWQTVSLPGPHDFHIEFGRPGRRRVRPAPSRRSRTLSASRSPCTTPHTGAEHLRSYAFA